MFETIKQRFRDMSTIKSLCLAAEQHANTDGRKEPGAEHFVLAALESPDGTARKAFEHIRVDPNSFRAAIAQHGEAVRALRAMGADPKALADAAMVEISAATVYEV